MSFVVTKSNMKMSIPSDIKEECNYVLLQQNTQQSFIENKDSSGSPLPKGVDLFETGDLKDNTSSDAEGYQFDADYAAHVEANYHFAGLSEASLNEAIPKLQQIFEEAGDRLTEEE